ncbi:hypothetical protein [Clostridium botulinum]|uniref:hypothetical protein n=1 Tax=Clostridium botulinum TaxID=1491 RepID=UPI0004DAFBF0|nr:hypothetical protein [Clostridium botulinum]KEI00112.1 hypothetical protein Z952_14100 [Clostridium botulinum C/D str. BKT75002]KEI06014.1 hypothetical protein Z954_14330 [Clostridium botulinum C/D str. BKT2873]QPW62165.1 hypothetical protein IG390_14745 [Clostridium botulinum]
MCAMVLMPRDKKIMKYIEEFKGVTISQCAKMFYQKSSLDNALYQARLRLKKLYDHKYIKRYKDVNTGKLVYTKGKKISTHQLYLMNVYAEIIRLGGEIIEFIKEPSFDTDKGERRGDGLIEFTIDEGQNLKSWHSLLIEVDKDHETDIRKMHYIFNSHILQKKYEKYQIDEQEIFPQVLIIKPYIPDKPYYTNDFKITYLDYTLNRFACSVLA